MDDTLEARPRGSSAGWILFVAGLLCLAALYGGTLYLRDYNPAFEVRVAKELGKILLFEQYPSRLVSRSVAFEEVVDVELVGAPTFVDPRRAEVWVNTTTGGRVRVHLGSAGMYTFAEDLAKSIERPLTVKDYEREMGGARAPRPEGGEAPPVQTGGPIR